ncbi:bacteriophage spanin2 family protein [Chryseobacterium sp. POL2]|uniref:bacteriophage spanin2 family protein n=1 Tax=Chryseobacterium sp. POL2 TaxID=2713414 RepID=UPI0013E1D119|nr:bacteriophage spanin2 family protein [Chryseobacterium sp. POL2]QIG89998.1 hypothetical protein G6R40_10140 [Chryseobacterium sp. POL2]
MKSLSKYFSFIGILTLLLVTSCQTRVVDGHKPLHDNTLELYKNYSIKTKDAKTLKMQILKVDADKIYGKLNNGEQKEIERNEIYEIKKTDYLSTILIALAAIAAVIFIPI